MRVCAAISRSPNEILVVRERIRGEERINLPGGAPHYEESLKDALVREVAEETGCVVAPTDIAYVAERRLARWDDVELTICFYAGLVRVGDLPLTTEISSIDWMRADDERLLFQVPEVAHFGDNQRCRYVNGFAGLTT